jgi:hypothetical protein
MLSNQVDASFSDKDVQEIMDALTLVSQKLNFAVRLSSDERQSIAKIGRKSQTFTEEALDMAEAHPELIPAGVSIPGARRDMELGMGLDDVIKDLSLRFKKAKSLVQTQ